MVKEKLHCKDVTFNIEGLIYNTISNNEGITTVSAPLQLGKHIITTKYSGMSQSNIITVN